MYKEYAGKLLDPRWQRKKSEIQIRDNFTCQICGSNTDTLHVHHLSYAPFGREPWDVPNSALLTLCDDCHKNEETHKRWINDTFMRAFGYLGYSNSNKEDLFKRLNEIIPYDPDDFREKLLEFVTNYVKEVTNGR